MPTCPKCRNKIVLDKSFCPICGAPFATTYNKRITRINFVYMICFCLLFLAAIAGSILGYYQLRFWHLAVMMAVFFGEAVFYLIMHHRSLSITVIAADAWIRAKRENVRALRPLITGYFLVGTVTSAVLGGIEYVNASQHYSWKIPLTCAVVYVVFLALAFVVRYAEGRGADNEIREFEARRQGEPTPDQVQQHLQDLRAGRSGMIYQTTGFIAVFLVGLLQLTLFGTQLFRPAYELLNTVLYTKVLGFALVGVPLLFFCVGAVVVKLWHASARFKRMSASSHNQGISGNDWVLLCLLVLFTIPMMFMFALQAISQASVDAKMLTSDEIRRCSKYLYAAKFTDDHRAVGGPWLAFQLTPEKERIFVDSRQMDPPKNIQIVLVASMLGVEWVNSSVLTTQQSHRYYVQIVHNADLSGCGE